ncbi:MAG: hypothetical protein HN337_10025 [Deltaproteobacteria bacterium]|jgi:hypothetical protein|nr:hypothetical protein [Deltaproteobacteria bacterium]
MKLVELYKMLCRIYDIQNPQEIDRFIITDQAQKKDVSIGNRFSNRESLLIRESDDGLEIGLYISPDILRSIENNNPLDDPDALACVIEGTSHFLYLCECIEKGRKVTQLELELQAEVDKFLLLHLIAHSDGGSISPALFNMQFENHAFDPALDPSEIQRYRDANRFAAKYCHQLLSNYFNPLRFSDLLVQVRDFFHKNLSEKIWMLTP